MLHISIPEYCSCSDFEASRRNSSRYSSDNCEDSKSLAGRSRRNRARSRWRISPSARAISSLGAFGFNCMIRYTIYPEHRTYFEISSQRTLRIPRSILWITDGGAVSHTRSWFGGGDSELRFKNSNKVSILMAISREAVERIR